MIPVFEPDIGEEEIAAVAGAIRRGAISGSFGESIPCFEEAFAAYCGCKYGIAVSSITAALHLALAALYLNPVHQMLVTTYTNTYYLVSTTPQNTHPSPRHSDP